MRKKDPRGWRPAASRGKADGLGSAHPQGVGTGDAADAKRGNSDLLDFSKKGGKSLSLARGAYSAVSGLIVVRTWLMRSAGKPPRRACSRINSSLGAR